MLVDLDKSMLAALVRGMYPAYEIMDHPLIKQKGYYTGAHSDRWNWNHGFESSCTEEDLCETYELLKNPKPYIKPQSVWTPTPPTTTSASLGDALYGIEGVSYVEIQDNYNMTINITVIGGEDEDIAKVLCNKLPMWCGLIGDYTVSTTQHGFTCSYRINRKQHITTGNSE
nr:MAG TPA: Protein of unknown function (DUF2612) [Caudoviricetes sp.]